MLDKASRGELELYINVVTLSEVLYVASRIYGVAGITNPNEEALDFIEWIKTMARIVGVNEDLALRAGGLKKQLHIALSDCYVIATAEAFGATLLFKNGKGK